MSSSPGRRGFTLIELLVVIAIIAVLVGLLLPAIQKVRSLSNRSKCQNNLKQMGIALHAYHDARGTYPAGVNETGAAGRPYNWWSWMALILPYMEQSTAYDHASSWAQRTGSWQTGGPPYYWWPWGDFWTNPPFATARANPVLGQPLECFRCPSDNRGLIVREIDGMDIAFTFYLGVSGTAGNANNGLLFLRSKVRMADITDGTSNTLAVGERPPSADLWYGWWFAGAGYDSRGTGDVVLGARDTGYASSLGCPTSKVGLQPGLVQEDCDQPHFWSQHENGTNFLLADGSVRFVKYNTDRILPQLCTRGGSEPIDGGF